MSRITKIKTTVKIDFMHIYKIVCDKGFNLSVNNSKPTDNIFSFGKSIRFIDLTEEDWGYEVRILFLASESDYELYKNIIQTIMELTGVSAEYENELQINDCEQFFNKNFIEDAINDDINVLLINLKNEFNIVIYGPLRSFHIGKNIYNQIKHFSNDKIKNYLFEKIRVSQYSDPKAINNAVYEISPQNENETSLQTLTVYSKTELNSYIEKADFFALIDEPSKINLIIKFDNLNNIKPDTWFLYDEYGYYAPKINDEQWTKMCKKAQNYIVKS